MKQSELEIIKNLSIEAGNILMSYRNKNLSIETKKDKYDLVTEADRASDTFLLKKLSELFPNDQVLTEESQDTIKDYSGRVWMVDPLDGTKHYIAGYDGFSVMIGLAIDGKPELGVVYAPARELLYWAEKDKGAFKQKINNEPKKLKVSKIDNILDSRLVIRYRRGEVRPTDSFIDALLVKQKIPEASVGLKLGKIAEGKADAVFNLNTRANKWDYCAPEIILREAGGTLSDLEGNSLDYLLLENKFKVMTVASNQLLQKVLLQRINDYFKNQQHTPISP